MIRILIKVGEIIQVKKKFYLHPHSIFPILLVNILFIAMMLYFVIGYGINERLYGKDDYVINAGTGQQFSILLLSLLNDNSHKNLV